MLQTAKVELPSRRQLIKHRTQVTPKRAGAAEESLDRFLRLLQLLHMGQEPTCLDGKAESAGCARGPTGEGVRLRQAIKAVVDFDGIEHGRVVFKPPFERVVVTIEIPAPVFVLPARASDPHALARGHRLNPWQS